MFAKRTRHRFIFLILIGIAALAASAAGSRTSAQKAGEPPLDQLFEDAFAAVAGVTDPSSRLYIAQLLSKADVNYGGGRLEERLVSILEPALKEAPTDQQASTMSYFAATLAVYGRTSELLAVMRNLNDAWSYGAKVLKILAKKGDVATAIILAERESKPNLRLKALINIVHALAENEQTQEAQQIFNQVQSIYGAFSEFYRNSYASDYLAALAHFDLRQAERLALGLGREQDRSRALLALTRIVAKRDPERALGLVLKIEDDMYREFAAIPVIFATAGNQGQQKIYQQALAEADPMGRAYAFRKAAQDALASGKFGLAREALDQLDAILPALSEEDRVQVANRAAIRLAIEVLSGDVNQVFEMMEGLTYSDDLAEITVAWIIANALRQNGHYDLGRRVAENLHGTLSYASYFIAAINARFE